jgi:5-methylcytosine-specific restriction enzyme B
MSDIVIPEDLRKSVADRMSSGELLNQAQIEAHLSAFMAHFGPDQLSRLDGEALLRCMHGRSDPNERCMMYWLEFKNDDEFPARYGGIGGGAATKFGIYQRQSDSAWITGSSTKLQVISTDEACVLARKQREELLAGVQALASLPIGDMSDDVYASLQKAMEAGAPELCRSGWAHKYWFLCAPDRLDDFHSPRWQRFYLYKLLQLPPDMSGVLEWNAPRFNCAGRFVVLARMVDVPVPALTTALTLHYGSLHRYWRIETRSGGTKESRWPQMRDQSLVSIRWNNTGDLAPLIGKSDARNRIRDLVAAGVETDGSATRAANQLIRFARDMAEDDVVLACDGMEVLGIGHVKGGYEFREDLGSHHTRAVEWRDISRWTMPEREGLQSMLAEMGDRPQNLLATERKLRSPLLPVSPPVRPRTETVVEVRRPIRRVLLRLDPIAERIEAALHRRGQVILHGPPGTGKTYHAIRVARELAARTVFEASYDDLTSTQSTMIAGNTGADGLVRICSFHPGYGYEDFIEGLRPYESGGAMVFRSRDGIFKRMCTDAAGSPDRPHFLIVDEINRGDVPRIFGELMTVLELDKRDQKVMLPLSGETLSVPRSLFIIATMNTADRSIALLDAALRRRFAFIELMPDAKALSGLQAGSLALDEWLEALNSRLRAHLQHDARSRQVGHAYLLTTPPVTSVAAFARILRDEIVPLIQEYCADDFAVVEQILGKDLIDKAGATLRHELFDPSREDALIEAVMRGLEISGTTASMEQGDEPADENDRS